jgi:ferric-dicitrate binding protein FerR (iron transport regulator)
MHDALEVALDAVCELGDSLSDLTHSRDSRKRRRSKAWRRIGWGLGAALLLLLLWWLFA